MNNINAKYKIMNIILYGFVLPIIAGLFLNYGLANLEWTNIGLHSVAETIALFAGIILAILLYQQQWEDKEITHYILIASALLVISILNGFHSSVHPGKTFLWFNNSAFLFGGFLFAAVWFSDKLTRSRNVGILPWVVAALAVVFGIASLSFSAALPAMESESGFTTLALVMNIMAGAFFVIAAINFFIRYWNKNKPEDLQLALFCLLNAAAFFLSPYFQIWDAGWWFWHLIRVLAYLILCSYFILIFQRKRVKELQNTKSELEQKLEELAKVNNARQNSERELQIRNKIATIFLTIPDDKQYGEVLNVFLEAMKSEFGVFGYIDEEGALVVPTMTPHIWDKCQVPEKDIIFPRAIWGNSSWPRAILEKRIICSNEPSAIIPEGHIAIIRHISLPLIHQGKVIGLLQVANKETDYEDIDIKVFEMIGENIAPVLNARLQRDIFEKQRKTAEEKVHEVLRKIRETINVLVSSVSQILAATSQVASGTAEAATAVSQTTTTVDEVKQTALLSAQKAKYVSDNAQSKTQVAQSGKKSIEQVIEGMQRIREQMQSIANSIIRLSEQSHAISEITTTVKEISEQSHLLAVNAAIEAAKAGEHGKGFTVVAQEIKNLAEQSKQSTVQVRSILQDVQKAISTAVMQTEQGSKAVEAGVKESMESGESIRMLASSIVETAQAATQIAASSHQQLVGMDQIASAMENIKQSSLQNLESIRQVETAATNLNELGLKLKELADQYSG